MKKATIVCMVMIFFAASMWAQSMIKKQPAQVVKPFRKIVVKAPNGGEVWFVGKAYQVKWTEMGPIGDVRHVLFACPSGPEWILGTVPADKKDLKYFYQILPQFAGHGQYKVRVTTLDGKVKDESDAPFYIRSRKLTVDPQVDPKNVRFRTKPFIRIVRPPEGFVFRLPQKAIIRVELSSKSVILLHIYKPGHSGVYRARKIQESELRQTRSGFFAGVLKIGLDAGRYHVIAAPQTHLDQFPKVGAAGPVHFSMAPPAIPVQHK